MERMSNANRNGRPCPMITNRYIRPARTALCKPVSLSPHQEREVRQHSEQNRPSLLHPGKPAQHPVVVRDDLGG